MLITLITALPLAHSTGQQLPATIPIARTLLIDGHRNEASIINRVGRSPAGHIAVAFYREGNLRIHSRSGESVATVGRVGGGPGEFLAMAPLGWVGEHLLVAARPAIANEYSPVQRVHYGQDGRIWIEVSSPIRPQGLFYVLSPEGRLLGSVTTAATFRLHHADAHELLGTELDNDDVPSVVSYRFR